MKYTKIKNCRLCGSNLLKPIINFGLMSRLESHFWPTCRRFLKFCVFHLQKPMNVSGKIAPLAGLPRLP